MKANSSRPALSKAALTPTPWSSSWFQMTSIFGAAWSRLEAAFSPDSTVNSAATRLSTSWPQAFSASLKPCERSWVSGQRVDAGDLRDDGVVAETLVLDHLAGVGAGRDAHAVVVAEDRRTRGERRGELTVDVDHGDAGLHRLGRDVGERGAVGRQQHDRVDLVVDEGLDLADLEVGVVGALGRLELDVGVLLGLVDRGAVDGREPAVVGGRPGEADDDLLAGVVVVRHGPGGVAAGRGLGLVAGAAGQDEQRSERTTGHQPQPAELRGTGHVRLLGCAKRGSGKLRCPRWGGAGAARCRCCCASRAAAAAAPRRR